MKKYILTLFAGLLSFASVMAQSPESEWKLGYTARLGEPVYPCIGINCKKAQEEFVSKLVKVCMYRDKATAGFFTRGDWKSIVDPTDKGQCQEVLFADIPAKVLYLEAPLRKSTGMFLAGQQYIHCTPDDGRSESYLCSPAGSMSCKNPSIEAKSSGYDACSSEFFMPYDANPRYRILQPSLISQAVREANLIAALGQFVESKAKRAADEEIDIYRSTFDNAKTLDGIKAFEMRYASNDPDEFIAKLAPLKRALQIEAYRQRFASMRDITDIESFIADYSSDDPDGRLPSARRRLAEEQRIVAAEAKKEKDQKIADEKSRTLNELERQILWCKRQSINAQQAIDRENQIGRVSGYVNKIVLRQAGEVIVSCNESIPKNFGEYKQLGGKKSIAELK